MDQHTLLIAGADTDRRTFLAAQLDADGHTVHEAGDLAATVAKLSAHAIDVLLLGESSTPPTLPRCFGPCVPASTQRSIPGSRSSRSAPATS